MLKRSTAVAGLVGALALPAVAAAHGPQGHGHWHEHDRDDRSGWHRPGPGLEAIQLEAERTAEPLGLGAARPRLSWTLDAGDRRGARQTAYRIVVTRDGARDSWGHGRRDVVWDSGVVRSAQTQDVRYGGAPLQARGEYSWRVEVRDERGRSSWSDPASMELGLLQESDWKGAWIGAPGADDLPRGDPQAVARPEPLLRRAFTVGDDRRGRGHGHGHGDRDRVVRARLYATGLAYADFTLNGRPVTDAVLDPMFTRYDRRIYAVTHDVTDFVRRGDNVLGVRLGRGFFGMRQGSSWNWNRAPWITEPRVRAQLELTYADGRTETVATDPSWRVHDGPTLADSLYAGETYDARAAQPGWDRPGFDGSGWSPAVAVRAPGGRVESHDVEPIRVTEALRPTNVTSPAAGVYVFELPRVVAGWARVRVRGEAGQTITLRYGEKLRADGTVQNDNRFVRGESQTDRYTLSGSASGETWEPRYSYKGFRYVQLDGWPGAQPPTVNDLDGRVVHSDVTEIGEFASSNPLLDRMRRVTLDTLTNNYHGIPTDTPFYEKNGWTGDAMLTAETLMLEFDMRRLLPKWVDDIADSQAENGMVPAIAPDSGWGLGSYGQAPPWNAAFILVPWSLHQRYGDVDVLVEHYDAMRRYIEYELTRANPDGTHPSRLNDYLSPGYSTNSPEDPALAGTAYAYRNVLTFAEIAQTLGRGDDAARYRAAAARIRDAFNAAYLRDDAYVTTRDPEYRQTSNLMPLAFGLVPPEREAAVEARLLRDIADRGNHLNTGALGTRELLGELTRRGHGDLVYAVVMNPTYPSFRNILDEGATSWWEGWAPTVRSYDHTFVQGTINQWMIEWIAGIQPLEPGYAKALISPHELGDLRHAKASTITPHGPISAAWRRDHRGRFALDAEVPVGVTAYVDLPTQRAWEVSESGKPVRWADGVRQVDGAPDGHVRFEVQSGTYRFATGK